MPKTCGPCKGSNHPGCMGAWCLCSCDPATQSRAHADEVRRLNSRKVSGPLAALPERPRGWRCEAAPYDGAPPTPAEVLCVVAQKPATWAALCARWPTVRGAFISEQLRVLLGAELARTRRSDKKYFATPAGVAAIESIPKYGTALPPAATSRD